MGISAQELRLGNLIEYKIEDELDERKEWWEISKVDFQDLTWLDSNPEDADFRPIKITEEWLLKFGFDKENNELFDDWFDFTNGNVTIYYDLSKVKFMYLGTSLHVKYIHQLQNLYFALTGEELTQVSEGKNKNFV